MMEEMNIKNLEAGKVEVMKDFFRAEMAMPEEVIEQLKCNKIFQKVGGSEDNKMFVEFSEDNMPGIIYKYVRKMRRECNIITFIPDAYRDRASEMEKIAYQMRHSTPGLQHQDPVGLGRPHLGEEVEGQQGALQVCQHA